MLSQLLYFLGSHYFYFSFQMIMASGIIGIVTGRSVLPQTLDSITIVSLHSAFLSAAFLDTHVKHEALQID